MTLVQKEPKKIYKGSTQVRPTIDANTITVTWTETSNPASFNPVYSDGATWWTAGSTNFDDFFGYSAARIDTNWTEIATYTQTQSWWAGKLDMLQVTAMAPWTQNIMIKFPVMWIKMTKSGSNVTLSITKTTWRESDWYQYYAHCTWTISNPWTPKNALYLWAYPARLSGSVLKSNSGATPVTNQTQQELCTEAKNNGTWYNIIWFYQRMFVNALYMMKYWNPNWKSVIWNWVMTWNILNTWWLTSQKDATYWTTGTTTQMKLFWLEDWRWNVGEYIWWVYTDWSKKLYTMISWWDWTLTGWEWTWLTVWNTTWNNISSIAGNNIAMFAPIATVANGNYNTYYSSYTIAQQRWINLAPSWGWYIWQSNKCWPFWLDFYNADNMTNQYIWSRLMYL